MTKLCNGCGEVHSMIVVDKSFLFDVTHREDLSREEENSIRMVRKYASRLLCLCLPGVLSTQSL